MFNPASQSLASPGEREGGAAFELTQELPSMPLQARAKARAPTSVGVVVHQEAQVSKIWRSLATAARKSPLLGDYLAMSYLLGLGGSSEISTGSNSNRGSSASGAKYAFVVFRKFLSSRSGNSGL